MFYKFPVSSLVSPTFKKQKQKEITSHIGRQQKSKALAQMFLQAEVKPFKCPRKTYTTFRQSFTSEMSYLEEFLCLSQMDLSVLFKKSQSHRIYSCYLESC